jgi:hypothetical protein
LNRKNLGVSLTKLPRRGIGCFWPLILRRTTRIRWKRERERGCDVRVGGGDGGLTIGGGGELAGVAHSSATAHDSTNRRHRDDAEAMATSTCHLRTRGRRPKRWLPWPVAGTSPSLGKMALEATIQLKKWTEERGGEAHRAEKKRVEAARR